MNIGQLTEEVGWKVAYEWWRFEGGVSLLEFGWL